MSEISFSRLKYESSMVTFTEVPDEITLCFNITGCPCHCKGCFEPWLAEDTGTILDYAVLQSEIASHNHITCICFLGGDGRYNEIAQLIQLCKKDYPRMKFAMYSGIPGMVEVVAPYLDYYKIGSYQEKYGPLNKKTTNQHFFKKENGEWIDITYIFQKEKI